jgi:hypothetical protein
MKTGDWHVEVSVPKQSMIPLVDNNKKGSSKACSLKDTKRNAYESVDVDNKFDYDIVYDKRECSSVSEVASRSFETACHYCSGMH